MNYLPGNSIKTDGGKYVEGDDHSTIIINGQTRKKIVVLPQKPPYRTKTLIGRRDYVKNIIFSLEYERPYVLTLTGIGGVGKSSIAYSVCDELSKNGSFDYIVWISAKETTLTCEGIQRKEPDLKSLDSLLNKIVIDSGIEKRDEFQDLDITEKLKSVYTYLALAKFLIVIDNLETIQFDRELVEFISNIPQPSKILITTRIAKITGEKQINVPEMTETEAVELIREEAKAMNARELLNATDHNLRGISSKLGRIPLALTFLVSLSLERFSLADIENKIKDVSSTAIIDFCFSEIFSSLTILEREVFLSLVVMDKEDRRESVIIHINMTQDNPEDERQIKLALEKLQIISWIFREQVDYKEIYDMLPLTQIFGQSILDKNFGLEKQLREKYARELSSKKLFRTAEEQYKKLYEKIGACTEAEKLSTYLAQLALGHFERGRMKDSFKLIDEAISASPNLGYLYKVKGALLRRFGNLDEARDAYLKSYELSHKAYKPILKDLVMLEREAHNFIKVRDYAIEYLKHQDDKKIWQILAITTSRDLREYGIAEGYFKKAFYRQPTKDIWELHFNVTTHHAMAINYKQWALSLSYQDKEMRLDLIKQAIGHCDEGIKLEKDNMLCYELIQECKGLAAQV